MNNHTHSFLRDYFTANSLCNFETIHNFIPRADVLERALCSLADYGT